MELVFSQFFILWMVEFSDRWLQLKCISSFHVLGRLFLLNCRQESSDSVNEPLNIKGEQIEFDFIEVQLDSIVSCFFFQFKQWLLQVIKYTFLYQGYIVHKTINKEVMLDKFLMIFSEGTIGYIEMIITCWSKRWFGGRKKVLCC